MMRRQSFAILIALLPVLALNSPLPAQSDNFPSFIELEERPEGILIPHGDNLYVTGVDEGSIWRADLKTGEIEEFNGPTAGMALGMAYDPRTNYLFVARTMSAGMPNNLPAARVYDLTTGIEVRTYEFPNVAEACTWPYGPYHFINDVVVTRDGAYFTDSIYPCLYKLPLGPGGELPATAEEIAPASPPEPGYYPNFIPNGIVAAPNGKYLIVNDSKGGGLYKIALANPEWESIDIGSNLPGADGMLLMNRTLYVVQSRYNNPLGEDQVAIVKLDPMMSSGAVVGTITNDELGPDNLLCYPSTIDVFGPYLYVANAALNPEGNLAGCYKGVHKVVQIPRRTK